MIKLPDGYRLLKVGETRNPGDFYYLNISYYDVINDLNKWKPSLSLSGWHEANNINLLDNRG